MQNIHATSDERRLPGRSTQRCNERATTSVASISSKRRKSEQLRRLPKRMSGRQQVECVKIMFTERTYKRHRRNAPCGPE